MALLDARKAIDMFEKTRVPVLGIVENMSTYICPNCGHEAHIFGHGGARAEAERLGLPFLGEIPLDLAIRVAGDGGTPVRRRPRRPRGARLPRHRPPPDRRRHRLSGRRPGRRPPGAVRLAMNLQKYMRAYR